MIDGRWVPGGTAVGVAPYCAARSERNFTAADQFYPERYAPASAEDKEKFANDHFAAAQPFSLGPRNCIGRSMAYAEMNLVLSRVLWSYDLEALPGQQDWIRQLSSAVWEKGPFFVKVTRRSP